MISSTNKGIVLAAATAALLAAGATSTSLYAAKPVMVKCIGVKDQNGCPNGCPGKNEDEPKWSIMTKQECLRAGGRPVKIK